MKFIRAFHAWNTRNNYPYSKREYTLREHFKFGAFSAFLIAVILSSLWGFCGWVAGNW